jgi:hypothetical protein
MLLAPISGRKGAAMSREHRQRAAQTVFEMRRIIRQCRYLRGDEDSPLNRERLTQLAEYAELVESVAIQGLQSPMFAGRIFDD